jgi:hypothetical protein
MIAEPIKSCRAPRESTVARLKRQSRAADRVTRKVVIETRHKRIALIVGGLAILGIVAALVLNA